jgi:hypothetical protein
MSDLICIKIYTHRHAAELDKALLDARGIPAQIHADDLGGMMPGMVFSAKGVRLMVAADHAEEALTLLEQPSDEP